jgi:hypothetical protein
MILFTYQTLRRWLENLASFKNEESLMADFTLNACSFVISADLPIWN